MKITTKHKWLLSFGLSTVIFGFFLVAALISWNVWFSPIFILLSAAGIAIPIYYGHHYRRSDKEEKRRISDQKSLNSYYYNRWYTPADSTYLENELERTKRIEK